jgi:hypothetical protein
VPITVHAGDGDDTVIGGSAADRLFGEAGNDTLDGGVGRDLLIGGLDTDRCLLDDEPPITCDPAISLSASSVDVEATVQVTGTGWYPENGDVHVMLGLASSTTPELVSRAPDPAIGDIAAPFSAPTSDVTKTFKITACQLCPPESGAEVSDPESLEVVVPTGGGSATPARDAPMISVRPDSADPGADVRVRGEGWDAKGPPVQLTLQADDGSTVGPPVTVTKISDEGSFHLIVPAPDLDPGPYTVVACQPCGPTEELATADLTILAPSSAPWGWVVAGLLSFAAVATGTALWRRRVRQIGADQDVRCTIWMPTPTAELSVAPDDSAHHSIRLVPRDGSGRHEVEELIDA